MVRGGFLMDSSNAFSLINWNAFLHNIAIIYPPPARYVRNYYYANTRLFITGVGEIQSIDGTIQGDPKEMVIYTIVIISVILTLVEETSQVDNTTKTAAYADDLTAAETNVHLRNCWDTLCRLGPKFSYFPEGSKSWLIVKEKIVQKASLF